MRSTHHVTGMLVAAAFVAVGCSKGEGTAKKADVHSSPQAKPAATVTKSITTDKMDDEGFVTTTPKTPVKLVMSFADAEEAYRTGKYDDAAEFFDTYVSAHPKNAWGHYMLGLSASKAKDFTKAEKAFKDALTIDPKHVKSLTNLSRLMIDQKRFDEAIVSLTQASDIAKDSADVHRLLGRAYYGQGIKDEAATAYRRAIELDEKDAWSMNNLGLVLLEQGKAADAVPLFTKAVELRKDVPVFHNNLGMALEHTGHYKEAATAYAAALTVDPGFGKAKQNLARVEAIK